MSFTIINIYLLSVIFSLSTMFYCRYKILNDTETMDKIYKLINESEEPKEYFKEPFTVLFIPILNLFISFFMIWILNTSKEKLLEFFKED